MGKEIKNYICIADRHRRPDRQRNTAGRYRAGDKTEKEAKNFPENVRQQEKDAVPSSQENVTGE